MKKFIGIFTLLMCIFTTSCDDSNDSVEALSIIARESNITAAQGEVSITLSTEADKAVSNKEWCQTTLNGNMLYIVLDANPELEGRTAKVEIVKGNESLPYYITQPGNLIPVSETTEVAFDYHGGSREICINSAIPFTAIAEDNWLTVQVNEDKLKLSTSANYTQQTLATTVKITSGSLETTISVTQTGIVLIPETTSVLMYNSGEDQQTINVNSTLPFTAVTEDNSWLTVTYDDHSVTFTSTDNSGQPARSTKVTLTSGELTVIIDVTQRPIIYSDYLGSWNLTDANGTAYTLNIAQDEAGISYKITGWGKSVVATNSQYALTAYYHENTGAIFITEQDGIGTYTDENGEYEIAFFAQFPLKENISYWGGGNIVYLGVLLADKSVQWLNGNITYQGQKIDLIGGHYCLINPEGRIYSFTVDSPLMNNPTMTKAGTVRKTAAFTTRSIGISDTQRSSYSINNLQVEIKCDKREKINYDKILQDKVSNFLRKQ